MTMKHENFISHAAHWSRWEKKGTVNIEEHCGKIGPLAYFGGAMNQLIKFGKQCVIMQIKWLKCPYHFT